MRAEALLSAAVLLASLPAPAAELVEQERGFAVTFPKPHQAKDLPPSGGALGGKQWIYEIPGEAYALTCFKAADISGDDDPRLDAMRDALAGQFGAKAVDEQPLGMAGRAGRSLSVNAAVGAVRARLFVDKPGQQTCSLLAIGGARTEAKAAAFLQSFRFLSGPEPATVRSADAAFEATFPAPAREQTQTLPEGTYRGLTTEHEGLAYTVGVIATKAKLDGDPEKRLDGARDGILASVKMAKLVSESRLTADGQPGRDLELSAAGDLRMRVRLLLDARKNRMFQMMLIGRSARLKPELAAFFDSFHVLDGAAKGR